MPKPITLSDFEELKKTTKIICIDFWATWCPPCKVMGPIFDHVSEDSELSEVEFFKCDVDNEGDLSIVFNVSSIPTFTLIQFKGDGSFDPKKDVLQRITGTQDGITFKQNLIKALPKNNVVRLDINSSEPLAA